MNIQTLIQDASNKLKKKNIKSPLLDSEILMSKVIGKEREYIILNPNLDLIEKKIKYFKYLINQRALGKPVAYLIGKKDFWKYEFVITEDTLIPRPDSELMIEKVLK